MVNYSSIQNTIGKLKKTIVVICTFIFIFTSARTQSSYLNFSKSGDQIPIVTEKSVTSVLVSSNDYEGVLKIAELFCNDIEKVSGKKPVQYKDNPEAGAFYIIAGTIGKSEIIDKLIAEKKIDVSKVEGQWEATLIQTVVKPMKGVSKAIVVAGSDKRGTMYGLFDISQNMGVSPWHFWADVPVKKHKEVYLKKGTYVLESPKVKYRGIFLNDEMPALGSWARDTYGELNSKFYEHVFELIIRLKGNYLWPAMWDNAFYDDDPKNGTLANLYGVVMGTSHHEPLARAHQEWKRYGNGPWNYEENKDTLQKFWKEGMTRCKDLESIITIGMRGDGDEAMSEETATELLEKIVSDQRKIIEEATGKPASETPQIWALYKEVQEYYDKGMRVPEDVTLLLCDDNWGNVRVLPTEKDKNRKGGFGMYYHFDFVGGPVSYKWLNVTQLEKVWEQMNLSYKYGVDKIWLVNVGDLKPMELPISFFFDFAWNPEKIKAQDIPTYYTNWATQQFGREFAQEIGEILAKYTKFNARRTPEMLKPDTYSITNYREADSVLEDYLNIAKKAREIYGRMPNEMKDAYYQLVLFPVQICANLNNMYVASAKNRLYAQQKRASTNTYAKNVERDFEKDIELTNYYHTELAGGKWNYMMSQTHIGYTTWNQPDTNIMPQTIKYKPVEEAMMGIAIEGSEDSWPDSKEKAELPTFDAINNQKHFFEIYKKGLTPFLSTIKPSAEWINTSFKEIEIENDIKVFVTIDWEKAPKGTSEETITVSGADAAVTLHVRVINTDADAKGFVENNGVVSIEAMDYTEKHDTEDISWLTIPNLGRTASSVQAHPVNHEKQTLSKNTPHLSYDFFLFEGGNAEIELLLAPTLNFLKGEGLQFAVSIDNEEPIVVNMHENENEPDWTYPDWFNNSVSDHVKKKTVTIKKLAKGNHTLQYWLIDPGIVLQKIIIDMGGEKPSYLGPPASKKNN